MEKFKSIFEEFYLKNSAAANSNDTKNIDKNSDPEGKYYKTCQTNVEDQTKFYRDYLIYHEKDDIISDDIIEISNRGDINKLTNINVDELYAYVIITTKDDKDGKLYDHLLMAKIKNALEIGAKHMIIARYYNANSSKSEVIKDDNVVSAGEIKKTDNSIFSFNIESGTYLSLPEREYPAKVDIRRHTMKFFKQITLPNITFKLSETKFPPPNITQSDVDDLCKKKKRMNCYYWIKISVMITIKIITKL